MHDLAEFDPHPFAKMDNCGKRTVKELASLLRQYFVSLPNSSVEFYRKSRASWLRYAGPASRVRVSRFLFSFNIKLTRLRR